MVGFCHLKQAIHNKYLRNYSINNGGYLIYGSNGVIYSHVAQQSSPENKIAKFFDNDIIHVLYIPSQNKIEFKNVTKNQSSTMIMNKE